MEDLEDVAVVVLPTVISESSEAVVVDSAADLADPQPLLTAAAASVDHLLQLLMAVVLPTEAAAMAVEAMATHPAAVVGNLGGKFKSGDALFLFDHVSTPAHILDLGTKASNGD